MLIKRKDGESISSLLYRFTKGVQRSGVLREAKKRQHHSRPISRIKRKLSALHRETKKQERERNRKLGIVEK
jgi:small subunit ribosomal protein S21